MTERAAVPPGGSVGMPKEETLEEEVGGLDVGHHAVKVEAAGLRVVVPEGLALDVPVSPDVVVVGPGRSGDVDLRAGAEAVHEVGHQAAGARAREGLDGGTE